MTDHVPERRNSRSKRLSGRPSSLTPETEARILNAIRCGAPERMARAAAWTLERGMPDEFSLRYRIEHSVTERPFTLADAAARSLAGQQHRELREPKPNNGRKA